MKGGNNEKVLLDLNFPPFQEDLFHLDASDVKKILKKDHDGAYGKK